jgi:hypothetical protein
MHIKHTISPSFYIKYSRSYFMIGKLDEVVSEMVISESISADGEAMESCMVLRPCT